MESKVLIFNSFALTSILGPYYGPTHKVFLILSKLSKKSRAKIDEYYSEFTRIMAKYATEINADEEGCDFVTLPSDLFRIRFNAEKLSMDMTKKIAQLIQRVGNKEGYYFKNHYMHSFLNISDVHLDYKAAETLLPLAGIIEDIQVYSDKCNDDGFIRQMNLSDKIIIKTSQFVNRSSKMKLL